MTTLTKQYYRISEVSDMVGVKIDTLKRWSLSIDALKPRTTGGGHRKFSAEDIELVLRIKRLIRERGMGYDGVNKYLAESKAPWRDYKCSSRADALDLLREVTKMTADNPRAVSALNAVSEWVALQDGNDITKRHKISNN